MANTAIQLTTGMQQNLYALQNTNKLMELVQGRLATGLRVQSALDDPINYFAAKEHHNRANDLSARKDSMSESVQTVKSADSGIEGVTDLIAAAKSLAQSAISAGTTTEANTLMGQYNTTRSQINDLIRDAGYKGENLINGDTITVKFNQDGTKALSITGFDAYNGGTGLGITQAASWQDGTSISASTIDADIAELDSAVTTLRTETSKLANNLSIITSRQDFTDNMINVLETGAANLVNADMNVEGANMLMLQTRQALGTTSLSIASQAAQSVLRLF